MIGSRLGPYEVTARLGAGGMGEAYRATDTKLGRDVAIKVPPAELASDAGRLARFEREAKLLASLNHPNIAHIHGFESALLPDGRATPRSTCGSVGIETSPTLRASAPQRLFRRRTRGDYPLAVTPKGQVVLNALAETAAQPDPITVVLNWQSPLPAASR